MFSQSLIAVFKNLAEFHGYVAVKAVAPAQPQAEPEQKAASTDHAEALCCQA